MTKKSKEKQELSEHEKRIVKFINYLYILMLIVALMIICFYIRFTTGNMLVVFIALLLVIPGHLVARKMIQYHPQTRDPVEAIFGAEAVAESKKRYGEDKGE